ncbi:hypothetical protein CWE13_00265 [Aliidiomarina shirensis]|uniref:DUF3108 domain-containing protein n=1 Tax=Aliidiomarina shirensis TaxID=1048642 RepID=A0A432WWH1_9GAMM|nr:DUF3108 domain-containing protein [Aliidiomarina shirensis]RUO38124.1 hypothetical protein CWE13_00265 [Aliidiomarina shirensis]
MQLMYFLQRSERINPFVNASTNTLTQVPAIPVRHLAVIANVSAKAALHRACMRARIAYAVVGSSFITRTMLFGLLIAGGMLVSQPAAAGESERAASELTTTEPATTELTTKNTAVSLEWIETATQITQPYKATYDLNRRGRTHGTAERELTVNAAGEWRYQTNTRASILFLSDRRYNDSLFQMNGYYVEPITYEYARRGTGSDQDYRVRFQRAEKTLKTLDGEEVTAEWREHLLDANAVLHQLQIDVAIAEAQTFAYELIDEDGRNESYEFAITGEETMQVRGEAMPVIKVERVRDHNRRQTYFWFAPSLNYTLVGMQQIEEGKEQLRLVLTDLQFYEGG